MSTTTQFNASAARELTTQAQSLNGQYLRKETDDILDAIQTAAHAGKSSIDTSYTAQVIQDRLATLGFKVKFNPEYHQRDPAYLTVIW
jgi:hypothetical protein